MAWNVLLVLIRFWDVYPVYVEVCQNVVPVCPTFVLTVVAQLGQSFLKMTLLFYPIRFVIIFISKVAVVDLGAQN